MPFARPVAYAVFASLAMAQVPVLPEPPKPPEPPKIVAGVPVNYDEALIGTYQLPDPLVMTNGQRVRNAKTWTEKRRPEIVHLFEEQ